MDFKFESFLTFMTVPLVKPVTQVVLSISYSQHRENIATLLIFLSQGVSVETANQCGGKNKTSFAKN